MIISEVFLTIKNIEAFMEEKIPLYVVGVPEDEGNVELMKDKFEQVLQRVQKSIARITEARVNIKTKNKEGKRRLYEISALIVTDKEQFSYTETGWELSNILETIGQKLLRETTKNHSHRQRKSVRKKMD